MSAPVTTTGTLRPRADDPAFVEVNGQRFNAGTLGYEMGLRLARVLALCDQAEAMRVLPHSGALVDTAAIREALR